MPKSVPPTAPTLPPYPRRRLMAWGVVMGLLGLALALGDPGDDSQNGYAVTMQFLSLLAFLPLFCLAAYGFLADVGRLLRRESVRAAWVPATVTAWLCFACAASATDSLAGCGAGPNERVRMQAYTISQKLEQYAQAHNGDYPPAATWIAALSDEPGYANGHALPRTRWAKAGQTVALKPAALGLPGADAVAALYNVRLHEALPGGQKPVGAPERADDFGAMLYDMDPQTQSYVLYLIGKHDGHATVVAYFTNADLEALQMGPKQPSTI